jgi:phosphoenolpyruvate carboxylase
VSITCENHRSPFARHAIFRYLFTLRICCAGEPGLWADHLRKLKESGISESTIAAQFNKIRVEPVLTAHPTEAKRLAVLEQHRALYSSMVRRENQMWTHYLQEVFPSVLTDLDLRLRQTWVDMLIH